MVYVLHNALQVYDAIVDSMEGMFYTLSTAPTSLVLKEYLSLNYCGIHTQ